MHDSSEGKEFLKVEEGFRAKEYKDLNGYGTIGYGHKVLKGEVFGVISSVEGKGLLERDLIPVEDCINNNVHVPLTQYQFDALCSLVYNIGCKGFIISQVLHYLNMKDYLMAAESFKNWHTPNLMGRRLREIALFKEGVYAVEKR